MSGYRECVEVMMPSGAHAGAIACELLGLYGRDSRVAMPGQAEDNAPGST